MASTTGTGSPHQTSFRSDLVDGVSEEPIASIDELEAITPQLQVGYLDQQNQALERRVQRSERDRETLRQPNNDLTWSPLPNAPDIPHVVGRQDCACSGPHGDLRELVVCCRQRSIPGTVTVPGASPSR